MLPISLSRKADKKLTKTGLWAMTTRRATKNIEPGERGEKGRSLRRAGRSPRYDG